MYGCLTLVLVANEKEYENLVAFTNDLQANGKDEVYFFNQL